MKTLKLLNKIIILILFSFFFSSSTFSEDEPEDIWDLEKKQESDSSESVSDTSQVEIEINLESSEKLKINDVINSNISEEDKINIIGLLDPEKNGLTLDMWSKSDGEKIKKIISNIKKKKLSNDANELLEIILMTNSLVPKNNISEEKFINYKIEYLIDKNDKELIKSYLLKNKDSIYNSKLIKFYINDYLQNYQLNKSCEIFEFFNFSEDIYITKFKIFCLINNNKREEAQLLYDLVLEAGFRDDFFESKFNYLMEYNLNLDNKVSDTDILNLHLSHKTIPNFKYDTNENTPKFIWKYLSSSNLLEDIGEIDLQDREKILLIEKATHEKNYTEKELFELYKRFQFNINQLLNVKESYKSLENYEGRALLYQRLILTKDVNQSLDLALKLKESFNKDDISNAFQSELKRILSLIDEDKVPSNFSSFYFDNLKFETDNIKNTKINNKIIHQSKILKYFDGTYNLKKTEDELNKLLKSIKKNKKYFVTNKDYILLESLISDGIKISKKYNSLFEFNNANIPTDILSLMSNNETAMVLLRIIEIIGEDSVASLDSDTLYFIISILNNLDLDNIRNKIILKTLPLKL